MNRAIIPAAFGLGILAVLLSRNAQASAYSHYATFTAYDLQPYVINASEVDFSSGVKPAVNTDASSSWSLYSAPNQLGDAFDWGSWAYEVEPWGAQSIDVNFYPSENEIAMPIGMDDLILKVAAHLSQEEGFRGFIYDDVNGQPWAQSKRGNPTIGMGHLVTAADFATYGDNWTMNEDEGWALLLSDVNRHLAPIIPAVTVPLSLNQWIAITSLAFNAGPSAVKNSRFLKAVNRQDWPSAEYEFKDFNKATVVVDGVRVKKVVRGLTLRRGREWDLFATAQPVVYLA